MDAVTIYLDEEIDLAGTAHWLCAELMVQFAETRHAESYDYWGTELTRDVYETQASNVDVMHLTLCAWDAATQEFSAEVIDPRLNAAAKELCVNRGLSVEID